MVESERGGRERTRRRRKRGRGFCTLDKLIALEYVIVNCFLLKSADNLETTEMFSFLSLCGGSLIPRVH